MGESEAAANPPAQDQASAGTAERPTPSCVLLNTPLSDEWLGHEQRRLERYPVQASRPIAMRLLDDDTGDGSWHLADILDIGLGGLCLMLSGALKPSKGQRLQLDLRAHPDFGCSRMEAVVRWCRSAAGFTTLGIAFIQPLSRLPHLELERRSTRRDPNEELRDEP